MRMKFILLIFVSSINSSVREIMKKNSGMMHHKLVKDYSKKMTNLMLKQRQNYPCDRYLKDNEIDYTRQINVHYKNPVYGIIQLDGGNKFTILNHAFYSKKSQKEIVKNLRFKPALNPRFQIREPSNLQMQCILYAKIGARHFIINRLTVIIQVSFYSNCKDQRAVRFFELRGGSLTLSRVVFQNKEFQLTIQYQGQLQTGEIFNSQTKFYPDYSIRQSYNPRTLQGDYRWRWIREKFRKVKMSRLQQNTRSRRRRLADYEFAKQNRLLRNLTKKQKKKAEVSEKDFQKKHDKNLQRKLRRRSTSSTKRSTKSKIPTKQTKIPTTTHKKLKKPLTNTKGGQSQIKDVDKGYNMIIPNSPKQFFELGTLEGIWNSPTLIQCQGAIRKLNQQSNNANIQYSDLNELNQRSLLKGGKISLSTMKCIF